MIMIDHFMYFASVKIFDEKTKEEDYEKLGLIVRSPEAFFLCALSSMMESLCIICEHGGLEAISLFGYEQDGNFVRGSRMVCNVLK